MPVAVQSIGDLRAALVLALATIADLPATPQWPELLTPPVAVVMGLQIAYDDSTMTDHYLFNLTVYTGDLTDEGAQTRLDGHCDPSGPTSVRAAIERDPTLGGRVQYAVVTTMTNYGLHDYQNQRLWGAEFTVDVVAYRP